MADSNRDLNVSQLTVPPLSKFSNATRTEDSASRDKAVQVKRITNELELLKKSSFIQDANLDEESNITIVFRGENDSLFRNCNS